MENQFRIAAIILLTINGISAIGGGIGLMSDPNGELMEIPLSLLEKTPFKNYFIPGLILLLINGISSFGVGILVSMNKGKYPLFIILQGLVLVGWLSIQLFLNPKFFYPTMHLPFYAIGLLLCFIGYKLYK